MSSLSDLFTHFMNLTNINFYTKTESDNRYQLASNASTTTSNITDTSTYSNIGTSANSTQANINSAIDTKFGYYDTVECVVTYTDNTTETVNLVIYDDGS